MRAVVATYRRACSPPLFAVAPLCIPNLSMKSQEARPQGDKSATNNVLPVRPSSFRRCFIMYFQIIDEETRGTAARLPQIMPCLCKTLLGEHDRVACPSPWLPLPLSTYVRTYLGGGRLSTGKDSLGLDLLAIFTSNIPYVLRSFEVGRFELLMASWTTW